MRFEWGPTQTISVSFIFIVLVIYSASWNLWPDFFYQFWKIHSDYFFKYCFCYFLSFLSFWDSSYIEVRTSPKTPHLMSCFLCFKIPFLYLMWLFYLDLSSSLLIVSSVIKIDYRVIKFQLLLFLILKFQLQKVLCNFWFSAKITNILITFLKHICHNYFKVHFW